MYAEAYARFTARQYDATVLLLATSVETALKSYISEKGGELTQFMLDKMASPMLENLFVAAVEYCGMTAPSDFKKWLANLRVHRNNIAHKPTSSCVDPLEVGRWVAVVEGLMSAINGETIDVNVGKVVQPVGPKAVEKFTADTVGVILRSEPYRDMPPYHVLMTTGETYRMNNSSFKIIDKYKFKTPNN
jgi:hypothetical protein